MKENKQIKRYVAKSGYPIIQWTENGQSVSRIDNETLKMRRPTFGIRHLLSPLVSWIGKAILKYGYTIPTGKCYNLTAHQVESLSLRDTRRRQRFSIFS